MRTKSFKTESEALDFLMVQFNAGKQTYILELNSEWFEVRYW